MWPKIVVAGLILVFAFVMLALNEDTGPTYDESWDGQDTEDPEDRYDW